MTERIHSIAERGRKIAGSIDRLKTAANKARAYMPRVASLIDQEIAELKLVLHRELDAARQPDTEPNNWTIGPLP